MGSWAEICTPVNTGCQRAALSDGANLTSSALMPWRSGALPFRELEKLATSSGMVPQTSSRRGPRLPHGLSWAALHHISSEQH
eukprot:3456770-Karenia_brevis.AAC.1